MLTYIMKIIQSVNNCEEISAILQLCTVYTVHSRREGRKWVLALTHSLTHSHLCRWINRYCVTYLSYHKTKKYMCILYRYFFSLGRILSSY